MILKVEDALKLLRRTDPDSKACQDLKRVLFPTACSVLDTSFAYGREVHFGSIFESLLINLITAISRKNLPV